MKIEGGFFFNGKSIRLLNLLSYNDTLRRRTIIFAGKSEQVESGTSVFLTFIMRANDIIMPKAARWIRENLRIDWSRLSASGSTLSFDTSSDSWFEDILRDSRI